MIESILNLQDQGLGEDEIVFFLRITHKRYRKLVKYPGALTIGARAELVNMDASVSVAKAAELYKVFPKDIRRARRTVVYQEYTPAKLKDMLVSDNSETLDELISKVRAVFGMNIAEAKNALIETEHLRDKVSLKTVILKELSKGELSRAEIATKFNCSPSYVSHLASDASFAMVPSGRRTDWDEILKFAETNTDAETSRRFKCSRAAIAYQRSKRQK